MWAYSLDKENFNLAGETRESAIEAAEKEIRGLLEKYRRDRGNPDLIFVDGPVHTVYVGECEEHNPRFSNYCDILETLEEQAIDAGFDNTVDCWLSCLPKHWIQELNTAVDNVIFKWLRKHDLKPKFYKVPSLDEVQITVK